MGGGPGGKLPPAEIKLRNDLLRCLLRVYAATVTSVSMIPHRKVLLSSIAAAATILLPSCVVVPAPYPGRAVVYGPGVYAALPPGYYGSYYWYGGRYYYGGRLETGRYYWHGRYYGNRYYHNGRYYYGGRHYAGRR